MRGRFSRLLPLFLSLTLCVSAVCLPARAGTLLPDDVPAFRALTDAARETPARFEATLELRSWFPFDEAEVARVAAFVNTLTLGVSSSREGEETRTAFSLYAGDTEAFSVLEANAYGRATTRTTLLPDMLLLNAGDDRSALLAASGGTAATPLDSAPYSPEDAAQGYRSNAAALLSAVAPYAVEKRLTKKISGIGTAKAAVVSTVPAADVASVREPLLAYLLSGVSDSVRAELADAALLGKWTVSLYRSAEGVDMGVGITGTVKLADGKSRALTFLYGFSRDGSGRADTVTLKLPAKSGATNTYAVTSSVTLTTKDGVADYDVECTVKRTESGTTRTYLTKVALKAADKQGETRLTGSVGLDVTVSGKTDTTTYFLVKPNVTFPTYVPAPDDAEPASEVAVWQVAEGGGDSAGDAGGENEDAAGDAGIPAVAEGGADAADAGTPAAATTPAPFTPTGKVYILYQRNATRLFDGMVYLKPAERAISLEEERGTAAEIVTLDALTDAERQALFTRAAGNLAGLLVRFGLGQEGEAKGFLTEGLLPEDLQKLTEALSALE